MGAMLVYLKVALRSASTNLIYKFWRAGHSRAKNQMYTSLEYVIQIALRNHGKHRKIG